MPFLGVLIKRENRQTRVSASITLSRMGARALAVVAALAVTAWGYTQVTAPGPVPTGDILVDLAHENWGRGHCGSGEYKWACLLITEIKLDRSSVDWEPRDKHEDYRACFDISVQVETTPWDSAQGVPSDPRTYIEASEPLRQCADVHYFAGDEDEVSAWVFTPVGRDWWKETSEALLNLLCANVEGYCPTV